MLVWFHLLWMGELTLALSLILSLSLPALSFHLPHLSFIPFVGGDVDVFGGVAVVGHWLLLVMVLWAGNMKPARIGQILFLICYFPFFLFVSFLFVVWHTPSIRNVFQTGTTALLLLVFSAIAQYIEEGQWKGVRGYPLVGNLPQFLKHRDRKHQYELELAREHGLTFFVRAADIRGVFVCDPRDVEYMLKTNQQNFEQGYFRRVLFTDFLGDGIFNVDGHKWLLQRKAAAKEFSVSRFRDYMLLIFTEYAHQVVDDHLAKIADTERVIDLQDMFFRDTFDSFGQLAFGVKVGCLQSESAPPFAFAFDRANVLTTFRSGDVFWPIKKLFNIGSEREYAGHLRIISEFVFSIIHARKQMTLAELEQKSDFLSRFMTMKDENVRFFVWFVCLCGLCVC